MKFKHDDLERFNAGEIDYEELVNITTAAYKSESDEPEDENPDGNDDNPDDKKDTKTKVIIEDKVEQKKVDTEDPDYAAFLEFKKSKQQPSVETFVLEYDNKINAKKKEVESITDETAEAYMKKHFEDKGMGDYADIAIEKLIANNELVSKVKSLMDTEIKDMESQKTSAKEKYEATIKEENDRVAKEQAVAIEKFTTSIETTEVHGIKLDGKEAKKVAQEVIDNPNYFGELFVKDPTLLNKFLVLHAKGFFGKKGADLFAEKNIHSYIGDNELGKRNNGSNRKSKTTLNP